MKITEVSLGFPVNKTIETNFENYSDALTCFKDSKYNYKLIIHLTEEQRKKVTEQTIIDTFKANNPQTESVKVVFDVQRTQHIRAPEIIHAKTNCEKLEEYLKVNEITVDKNIFDLEKEIEDNLVIKYTRPTHSFTLLKVYLKGSIGLHEKSGRDEFELDFRKFPDGLIALTGRIGAGKTTLIENCHPYPQMLTRSSKLQDHFYLKDSCRQLLYVDEEGTYYDIDLQIDGHNKTGKVKAFVKTGKDINVLTPVSECDGNVDSYTKWVNDTFGSIELYLRTAFYTRGKTGSIPDIAYATKGEKKALFSTLIGIDGLTDISVAAREKSKLVAKEIDRLEAKIVDLEDCDTVEDIEENLKNDNECIVELDNQITKTMKSISDLKKTLTEDVSDKIEALERQRDALEDERIEIIPDIDFIENYKKLEKSYDTLEELFTKSNAANKEYFDYKENTYGPLSIEYNTLLANIASKENSIKVLETKFETLEENLVKDIDDTCPTCGQKLPADKIKELTDALNAKKAELSEIGDKIVAQKEELTTLRTDSCATAFHDAEVNLSKLSDKKNKLSDEIEALDLGITEDNLKEIRLKYKSIKSPETLNDRLEKVNSQIEELTSEITKLSELDNSETNAKIAAYEEKLATYEHQKKELFIEIGRLEEQKNTLIETIKQNEALEHQIDENKSIQAQYDVLEKAFGANGIQALELEALSPEIADITNHVLETVFGGEFKVSFQTLRIGSNGNLIEDFNILVETVSTGTVRPLEWVSGGEGTIVKEALYNAFSIARQKSCGISFKTKFLDEMDSAIDPDFRPKYLSMVKAVHDISGTKHTVMITHSSEIKDAIENRIEL